MLKPKTILLSLFCILSLPSHAGQQDPAIDAIESYSHCDYNAALSKARHVVKQYAENDTTVLAGNAVIIRSLEALGKPEDATKVRKNLIKRYTPKGYDVTAMLESISIDAADCADGLAGK